MDAIFQRLFDVAGCRSQLELAAFLGIRRNPPFPMQSGGASFRLTGFTFCKRPKDQADWDTVRHFAAI